MESYLDFRQELIDLKDKRVRLCIRIDETDRVYEYYGWIRNINDHTLTFEADITTGNTEIRVSHLNLNAVIIYAVDEIDEEADLSDKPDQDYVGERTEYIPYDKEGQPIREPQPGYVILHKDHIYAKGTVYTLLRKEEPTSGGTEA